MYKNTRDRAYTIFHRGLDIVISLTALLFLLPFFPIIAFIIKYQSPGPLFFGQERTGLNGRTFRMYKFRSMHVNDDSNRVQATLNDPRKFPFGKIMRKTSIDELPQIYNVLLGEMSLIGLRPHMLAHTEYYSKHIPYYMDRHAVKPGLTGWAQVTGWRGDTPELWMMEERLRHDLYYIEHRNTKMDLAIIRRSLGLFNKPQEHAH